MAVACQRGAMTRRLTLAIPALVLLAFTLAPAADAPVGRWKTVDDKTGKMESEVELYQEGGKLYGKIVSLADPTDAAGKPRRCTKCTGDDKDKPILGLVIIKGLSASGDRYKGGTITDPGDGKVYKAEVWTEGGTLKVRGYVSMFYKTQTWQKAN
jgi:uncharacterized protein (DUF2147 family)